MSHKVVKILDKQYDVAVIGGGTAGVVAAIQSARAGAKTLLIEKNELLGGTITQAEVRFPGLFHAWKKQIIAGIGWELVCKAVEEAGGTFPDFEAQEQDHHWRQQVRIEPAVYALICDEMVCKAGVEVLFDTMPASLEETENGKRLTICTKSGLTVISVKVIIDCTGDANAATLAGYATEQSEECQPGSYYCHLDGYDAASLDMDLIGRHFDEEVKKGTFAYSDMSWHIDSFDPKWINAYGAGGNHVYLPDAAGQTSEDRTAIALRARLTILNLYRFCKKQPGMKNVRIQSLAHECGIRETVRIIGKKKITSEDYIRGTRYGDDVCYSFYPIDIHTHSGIGLDKRCLEPGIVPTIPRGALLPAGSRNFLVAGRCIASDQAANSALRVEATCMATGQAAGALAALAAKSGLDVEEVPMEQLYEVLRQNGAIIPQSINK